MEKKGKESYKGLPLMKFKVLPVLSLSVLCNVRVLSDKEIKIRPKIATTLQEEFRIFNTSVW